jgi:ribosomal protein S18 acetylase RimI-like enzyme
MQSYTTSTDTYLFMSQGDREIRRGTVADASKIARTHVASWHETYAGIVPDEMLAALSVSRRTVAWENILRDPSKHENSAVYVKEVGDTIVGFGACGEQRNIDLKNQGYDGEIGSVYVLREFQKRGIGRDIMSALARDLVGRGLHGAALWVLRENTLARRFYEQCAGQMIGEKQDVRGEATLIEVAYGWSDIGMLQERVQCGQSR